MTDRTAEKDQRPWCPECGPDCALHGTPPEASMDDASERSVPSISSATCLECGAKWGQAPRPWGDSVMELDAYAEHEREHNMEGSAACSTTAGATSEGASSAAATEMSSSASRSPTDRELASGTSSVSQSPTSPPTPVSTATRSIESSESSTSSSTPDWSEFDDLREGVAAVIRDRYAGDFAPILPKLQALLDVVAPPGATASSE